MAAEHHFHSLLEGNESQEKQKLFLSICDLFTNFISFYIHFIITEAVGPVRGDAIKEQWHI